MSFSNNLRVASVAFLSIITSACSSGNRLNAEQLKGAEAQADIFRGKINSITDRAIKIFKTAIANVDGSTEIKLTRETIKLLKERGCID